MAQNVGQQLRSNVVALISLTVALTALGYNERAMLVAVAVLTLIRMRVLVFLLV
jgi:hypothetical protein